MQPRRRQKASPTGSRSIDWATSIALALAESGSFHPRESTWGMIELPEVPANCTWGDEESKTLYIAARTGLYRIKLNIKGIRP